MASDLKSLAVMVAGGVLGVAMVRKAGFMPEVFSVAGGPMKTLIPLPEAGLGVGKDNMPNTVAYLPAAVAVGAYFLM